MRLQVQRETRIRFLVICSVLVVVATTIYVSAASRQAVPRPSEAMDVEDPAQVRQALLFNPFEPEGPTQVALSSDQRETLAEASPRIAAVGAQLALADSSAGAVQSSSGALSQGAKAKTASAAGKTTKLSAKPSGKAVASSAGKGKAAAPAAKVATANAIKATKMKGLFGTAITAKTALIGGGIAAAVAGGTIAAVAAADDNKSSRSPAVPAP